MWSPEVTIPDNNYTLQFVSTSSCAVRPDTSRLVHVQHAGITNGQLSQGSAANDLQGSVVKFPCNYNVKWDSPEIVKVDVTLCKRNGMVLTDCQVLTTKNQMNTHAWMPSLSLASG